VASLAVATAPRPLVHERIKIPYRPRRWAKALHLALQRFLVLVLHRRAGKTTGILNHHLRAATSDAWERRRLLYLRERMVRGPEGASGFTERQLRDLLRAREYGHVMPTKVQAEAVAWGKLKWYADPIPGRRFNEQKLRVTFPGGHRIQLFGADDPDALRGLGPSGLSFDEYSQQPDTIFGEVLSKALADHLGYAIFAGTIKGTDQLYKMHEVAKANAAMWFALWQDVRRSLQTEEDITIALLEQAMADDRELISKGIMSQAEYDQEWFLSPDAAIKGAYYAKELARAREKGRITHVPYDENLLVGTAWDLGIDDTMAIWFWQQSPAGQVRIIDYYQAEGEGLPHYAKVLQDKSDAHGYVYGTPDTTDDGSSMHLAPHDIKVRELGTGKSRLETAKRLGIRFRRVKDIGLADGINAVRALLSRCWFNEETCRAGLHALRNYKKQFNKAMNEFTGTPVHNWASHPADAFRTLAVGLKEPDEHDESTETQDDGMPDSRYGGSGEGWAI